MNWTTRKGALVCVVFNILVVAGLILWNGKADELAFLKKVIARNSNAKHFMSYKFVECIPTCISDVVLVDVARTLFIFLIYVVGGYVSWIPALVSFSTNLFILPGN